MDQGERVRIRTSDKRVRAFLGGSKVLDTIHPVLVWEVPYYPAYYVPAEDVTATLTPTGEREGSATLGEAELFDVDAGGRVAHAAAWRYSNSPITALRDLVRFDWDAMTEWFEEDEPVYTHPRDPYTRVDILTSSRRVQIVVNGVTVAESRRPTILFETGLPPRYYLPLTDVRKDLLRRSHKQTRCPYKGTASYWSLEAGGEVYEDLVWTYRSPLAESQKIAGLVAFYNERVDLFVDGELQKRPRTKFSA